MKNSLISVLFIGLITFAAGLSYSRDEPDEPVSRYQTEISGKEVDCFFNQVKMHLSSSEDIRLLQLQQAAIQNLAKTWRYDEQYVITIDGQRSDIDLTVYFDVNNPRLIFLYTAGMKKAPFDILIKKIEMQCNIHFKPYEKSSIPRQKKLN